MAEPLRMCAGCREHFEKKQLLRIVKTPDGGLILDAKAKASGRGVYLCRNIRCFEKAKKSRALDRMLKTTVPQEVYNALEESLRKEL